MLSIGIEFALDASSSCPESSSLRSTSASNGECHRALGLPMDLERVALGLKFSVRVCVLR